MSYAERLSETLPAVRERIERAAARAGRSAEEVTLVAVTKGHPFEVIEAAIDAGLTELGENRVAELEEKVERFGHPEGVRWHMIGGVQSRKASRLPGLADMVQSVDRMKIARKLDGAVGGAPLAVLAQVNTSGEDAKGGFEGDRVIEEILEVAELEHLRLEGLMTMAPFVDDESVLRATFRGLRETLEGVRRHAPEVGGVLSMGMTNDLEIAIEEGSTMIRIGTALFGDRPGYDAG
jgi:pyridoxal phosphate enzyme (YggS family)